MLRCLQLAQVEVLARRPRIAFDPAFDKASQTAFELAAYVVG